MTGETLAKTFETFLLRGDGYIYGLNNELYTAERAKKLNAKNPKNAKGDKWIGKYCSDCSGGIVGAIRMENPDYIDRSADSFAVQFVGGKQDIKTIPDVRGLAVWKSGHIGIYVGNGEVIEFRGVSYGCVKTKLSDPKRPWTHWGYIAGVDYADELTYPRQMVVATKQSSLNLRSAANIGDVIAKMPKNAPVWAMRESGGWCECVYYDGAAYHQGWASKEYLS